jgi:hypothetical protein
VGVHPFSEQKTTEGDVYFHMLELFPQTESSENGKDTAVLFSHVVEVVSHFSHMPRNSLNFQTASPEDGNHMPLDGIIWEYVHTLHTGTKRESP